MKPARNASRLYQAHRHLPLAPERWDESLARETIRQIAEDAVAHFDGERFWPAHPLDEGIPEPCTGLYFGAAGVIWGLDELRRRGAIGQIRDFAPAMPRLLRANRTEYAAMPYPQHGSLLMGDVGVLLAAMRLAPSARIADALFARVQANDDQPLLELMWGTPGTMLACICMDGVDGETRWRDAFRHQARRLLSALEQTTHYGALWTQTLYGDTLRYLGAVHGYAGNMWALLQGWHRLEPEQRDRIAATVPQTLAATAKRSDGLVNWPAVAGEAKAQLVQICHGAPGLVTVFADSPFATPELDGLLAAGGELIWRAGPLAKGTNLCHGTAGNGYAFLKLHRRFGNGPWLQRARAFAMTAIAQCEAARRRYGQGRYSLWTGDVGVALYLWDCITATPRFPLIETS